MVQWTNHKISHINANNRFQCLLCLDTDEFVALLPRIYIPRFPVSYLAFNLRNRSLVATAIELIYESETFIENVKIMVINIWLKSLMRNICV